MRWETCSVMILTGCFTLTQENETGIKKRRVLIIVIGIIIRIIVLVGVPYCFYRWFKIFPLNIWYFFLNLIRGRFSDMGKQLRNIFSIKAWIRTFLWHLLGMSIAFGFIAYCMIRDLLYGGFGFKDIILSVIKRLFPKLLARLIPFIGQIFMIFDIIRCFFVL